jgi:transposase
MIGYDGIMTFYKLWLKGFNDSDKVLYDLTSISYYGAGINAADWGYNRDHESLPQVNYALLCIRGTGMPLFAWPLTGSISDVSTLENTLEFLDKLGYKPNCLMLDRGFPSKDNIAYMLRRRYVFLQALKVNAKWVCDIIDAGEADRFRPDSMLTTEDRTYYVSTTHLQCVRCRKQSGSKEEEYFFYQAKGKRDRYKPQGNEAFEVIEQYPCQAHVLFCQDLVGCSWDRFMGNLNSEYTRLLNDPSAKVRPEYTSYFVIEKPKYARKRTVDFRMEAISKHKNKYAGYVCFLTNDPTIKTAEDAIKEYSTRDYIEKDFDEMKNDLDMNRIRVHTDDRMRSRLFIQFIAEIFLRDIRVRIRKSDICRKMTKAQIFSHIKAIYKVHFQGKYRDVTPQLSKKQRSILEALEIQI